MDGPQVAQKEREEQGDGKGAEEHGVRRADEVGKGAEEQPAHGAEPGGAHDVEADDAAAAVVRGGGLAEGVDADVGGGDGKAEHEGGGQGQPEVFREAEHDEGGHGGQQVRVGDPGAAPGQLLHGGPEGAGGCGHRGFSEGRGHR